jgi:hypothetical protein
MNRNEQIDAIVQGFAELNLVGTCYLAGVELDAVWRQLSFKSARKIKSEI